jgi:hypothetical protein
MALTPSPAVLEPCRPLVHVATDGSVPLRESVATSGSRTQAQRMLIGQQALVLMEDDAAASLAGAPGAARTPRT